jgi:hypothetical protein
MPTTGAWGPRCLGVEESNALWHIVSLFRSAEESGAQPLDQQCPLWVISGHADMPAPCPLYPR